MRLKLLIIPCLIATLVGCASAPDQPGVGHSARNGGAASLVDAKTASPFSPTNNEVIFRAFSLIGTPYRWGGSSPDTGFDCSGLINYVYREAAGVTLPRTTAGLTALKSQAPSQDLMPGDLVLFAMSGRSVDHAGIYVGEGRFLHAPSSGGKVRIDELQASYWQSTFKGARRVLR
ncbi:C40 family peptidase [Halopseudomonas sp.]|uniref:C40 family peptidase n=1 Tax=Halopseudomonas sp. TaxID=2901191 RepID=UPI003569D471